MIKKNFKITDIKKEDEIINILKNNDCFNSIINLIINDNDYLNKFLNIIIYHNMDDKFDFIINELKNKNKKIKPEIFENIIILNNLSYLNKIIPCVDLNYKNDYFLLYCIENSFLDGFKVLLPFYKNKEFKNNALLRASLFGHLDMVSILLKNNVNPKYKNNSAIKNAIKHNHTDIVNLLMPYSNLNEVRKFIETLDGDILINKYKNSIESYLSHKKISSQLIDELNQAKERKKRKM